MNEKLCPKCVGAKTIMEPKEERGFHYIRCVLCNGTGTVTQELSDDFELSINEDNLDTNDDW